MLIRTLTKQSLLCRASISLSHAVRLEQSLRLQPKWRIAWPATLTTTSSSMNEAARDTNETSQLIRKISQYTSRSIKQDDGQGIESAQDESNLHDDSSSPNPLEENGIEPSNAVKKAPEHQSVCSGYGWTMVMAPSSDAKVTWRPGHHPITLNLGMLMVWIGPLNVFATTFSNSNAQTI